MSVAFKFGTTRVLTGTALSDHDQTILVVVCLSFPSLNMAKLGIL